MSDTLRHPLCKPWTDEEKFAFFGFKGTLERHNAKLVRDFYPGDRGKIQSLRYAEKVTYRAKANLVVKNYLAGNIDDVVIGKQVHGYLD